MDDLRAIRTGLCDENQEAKCEAENGQLLEWSCIHCPKKKPEDLNPYTLKLVKMMELQAAGYPFRPNDLTMEEWYDIGKVKRWLETKEQSI